MFAAKANTVPPKYMVDIHSSLPDIDLPGIQDNYDVPAAITTNSIPYRYVLQGLSGDSAYHCFLVCTAVSYQHQQPWFHLFSVLQFLTNPDHPLHRSVVSWYRDIFEGKIPDMVIVPR